MYIYQSDLHTFILTPKLPAIPRNGRNRSARLSLNLLPQGKSRSRHRRLSRSRPPRSIRVPPSRRLQGLHHVAQSISVRSGLPCAERAAQPATGRAGHLGAGGQRADRGRGGAGARGGADDGSCRYIVCQCGRDVGGEI